VTQKAVTKSISIDAPAMRLLMFVADPLKWPRWSMFKVDDIRPTADDRWTLHTPIGSAALWLRRNAAVGMIEYVFTAQQSRWSVPGRVLNNGSDSEFILTLFRHEALSQRSFELLGAIVDCELAWLKKLQELR
jgi:uncharacterized membrane protein